MNAYYIIGAVMAVAVIVLHWFLHRLYKRIARRCRRKDCGCTHVKRVCKIFLAHDEAVSWRSPKGERRWWIRRVLKLTYTVCDCGWIELVKIDTDPISLWHAYWVKWFHKEQYHEDPSLNEATQRKLRQLYLNVYKIELDPQASDTPPLSLDDLAAGYFEAFDRMIGGGRG